ncbi:MAG: hypothetical protein R3F55_22440 [Alphaproteobacteria bacterium]
MPDCGAQPEAQHLDESCEGDVEAIIVAAAAEIEKIENLDTELRTTIGDLEAEVMTCAGRFKKMTDEYGTFDLRYKRA